MCKTTSENISKEEIQEALENLKKAGFDLESIGITADVNNQATLSAQLSQALANVNSSIATMEAAKEP